MSVDEPDIPDNYVAHTLKTTAPLPPITLRNFLFELNLKNNFVILGTPLLGCIGAYSTPLRWQTFLFSVAYYFFSGLGITAGYHRYWAHRSFNASESLQYFLAIAGAAGVQGSIRWWVRGHRAHHRYTDTELDPYNAHRGLFYSHVGWMLVNPRRNPGAADVSDLARSPVVKWQFRWYLILIFALTFVIPMAVAGWGWGDARGGVVYAGLLRLTFVHQSTFCVNSLAHWLGETPFDDKHTPRNHMLTAFVTVGEGYHNFHHQFPTDYRNAIRWYQYDPTKWFIFVMNLMGLASQLKRFPDNEINKGVLTMQLKKLHTQQEALNWPEKKEDLPVVEYEDFIKHSAERPLVLIAGFIHDVSAFAEEHPGGAHLINKFVGRDATTAFFGGVYEHSNAAHNLLAMKRVGILHGGHPHILDIAKTVPPSQRLKIALHEELAGIGEDFEGSTTVYSDDDSDAGVLGKMKKLEGKLF